MVVRLRDNRSSVVKYALWQLMKCYARFIWFTLMIQLLGLLFEFFQDLHIALSKENLY